jgi:hypothetical protein
MKSKRYTITLRASHPLERRVIEATEGVPQGLLADRLREFLLASVGRRSPNIPWESASIAQHLPRTVRRQVTLSLTDPKYGAITTVLQLVPPDLATEFLRDRILAGIAGEEVSPDIPIEAAERRHNLIQVSSHAISPVVRYADGGVALSNGSPSKGVPPEVVASSMHSTASKVFRSDPEVVLDPEEFEPMPAPTRSSGSQPSTAVRRSDGTVVFVEEEPRGIRSELSQLFG